MTAKPIKTVELALFSNLVCNTKDHITQLPCTLQLLSLSYTSETADKNGKFLNGTGASSENIKVNTPNFVFYLGGSVVRKPINANPRLKVNRGFHLAR